MGSITSVNNLPGNEYNNTGSVEIHIRGTSYFEVIGSGLNLVSGVSWYPSDPKSIKFIILPLNLVSTTNATLTIQIVDNFLDDCNRGGMLSFRFTDGTAISFPVITYGTLGRLWISSTEGLNTR